MSGGFSNTILLELSLVSSPSQVLEIGAVNNLPMVGDFVNREESGWVGYVKSRRWTVRKDGRGIDVRCWLQKDPP